MNNNVLSFLFGKSAAVVGLGISNLPLVEFLLDLDVKVTLRDQKETDELKLSIAPFLARGASCILGEGYLENLNEDFIFRSPGIRSDIPQFLAATRRGAVLSSEMELFFLSSPAKILGITGSDGKTTTTTLTYKLLEAELGQRKSGRVYVGGNIGAPLLPKVSRMTSEDIAVVELSSFQLSTMKKPPSRAVITNITPNHLNWHIEMEEYAAAKENILGAGLAVLNAENSRTLEIAKKRAAKKLPTAVFSSLRDEKQLLCVADFDIVYFAKDGEIIRCERGISRPVLSISKIKLPGIHNLENYMAALALTDGYISRETAEAFACEFEGVEHRLELVRVFDGVKYYNSSIDSTPTRTAAALSALGGRSIVICGGYDKHIPFDILALSLAKYAKSVILTGATADAIKAALENCPEFTSSNIAVLFNRDFTAAVSLARETAKSGDRVLLSPACASFDAFKNFEERGRRFIDIVNGFK